MVGISSSASGLRANLPRHRRLDGRGERLGLFRQPLSLVLLEFRHHVRGEQLEQLADVLVPVAAALLDEDDLVDASVLEAAQVLAHLLRRADAAADGVFHRLARRLELSPDIGAAGRVDADAIVVGEPEAKEPEPVLAATARLGFILVQ